MLECVWMCLMKNKNGLIDNCRRNLDKLIKQDRFYLYGGNLKEKEDVLNKYIIVFCFFKGYFFYYYFCIFFFCRVFSKFVCFYWFVKYLNLLIFCDFFIRSS